MVRNYEREISAALFLLVLAVLSFFLIRPILMSIIAGIILAFLFIPVFNYLKKKVNSKNLATVITSALLIVIIVIPLWFIIPLLLTESLQIYVIFQKLDIVSPLQNLFPAFFEDGSALSTEIVSAVYSFITGITSWAINAISDTILKFPTLFLQFLVSFFTFFFVVRDHEEFVKYLKSIIPFQRKVKDELFKSSKDITSSVIYGQVGVGIIQGLFAGLSFFLFGLDNALFLTFVAIIAGIFPIIGTSIVWAPVAAFLFISGSTFSGIGILAFGVISMFLENAVKPVFISKRTNVHSGVILLGMVGGIFYFGLLGVILGPLILSYLLIILETYRGREKSGIFIKHPEEEDN